MATYNNTGYFDAYGNPCNPCPTDPCDPKAATAGYEDYTGMGPTKFEETDLYARALNVSSPREAEPYTGERPANFRKKVVRRVEVPYTRKVKVATQTTKIVPTSVKMQVPVKKLVQVPSYKIVDEEYTVFEEREAVREKEIWVKQVVPEKYMQKVPVKMTRQVKKPTTEVQEIEELVNVDVPSTQAVQVDGFRIDEVEDTKLVEVEEFQEFEYREQPTGNSELARTRELGRVPRSRISRNVGNDVYAEGHPSLNCLDTDSNADALNQTDAQGTAELTRQMGTMNMDQNGVSTSRSGSATQSFYRDPNSGFNASGGFNNDNFTNTEFIRPAGTFRQLTSSNAAVVKAASGGLGLSVKNTHTRHTDGTGVLITKIEHSGAAALAGLQVNDIITNVNDAPTTTVEEFAEALKTNPGTVKVYYNRDGRRNGWTSLQR